MRSIAHDTYRPNIVQRVVERFGRREIADDDFDGGREARRLRVASERANRETVCTQLCDDLPADRAARAGDEDPRRYAHPSCLRLIASFQIFVM